MMEGLANPGSKLVLAGFLLVGLIAVGLPPAVDAGCTASVGTFNTFLFRGAPAFQERKDKLIEILQNRKENRAPDVLCLQEILRKSDAKEIMEEVKEDYPYHASFGNLETEPVQQRACTPVEARNTAACLNTNCLDVITDPNALLNCSYVECGGVLSSLSQACLTCLTVEFGAEEDNMTDTFARCASMIPANDYTAPYGLLLLSRYPLSDVTTSDFLDPPFKFSVRRGYIKAKLDALRQNVLCTHLTSPDSDLIYVGPLQFSSWEEQQANEVKSILEIVENTKRIILLGDFNHGPATPGDITWEVPINYGLMVARGLFSVNALWCGQCTLCSDNVLTGGRPNNLLVDHIYLPTSRASAVVFVERLFDSVCTSPHGVPLSDHYGVKAKIYTGRGNTHKCPKSNVLGSNAKFLAMDDLDSQAFCPV